MTAMRWPFAAASVALLPLLLMLAGCGGDGPEAAPASPAFTVTPGALSPAATEVLAGVARLRGLPLPSALRAGTVEPGEVRALLESLLTAEDRAAMARTTTLYRLLGYLGPEQEYEALYLDFVESALRGAYDPAGKTVWVVGLPGQSAEARLATEAHEFVHAIQDRAFDLLRGAKAAGDDLDASLARAALVEGDAVTHETLYLAGESGKPSAGTAGANLGATPAGLPAAIERELRFPYEAGLAWVRSVRAVGGTAAVDRLFAAPPRHTALVLHPELGADATWQPRAVSLPDLSKALGGGWRHESGGTLGEFQLRNYLQQQLGGLEAATAAAGWYGDRYDVYERKGESIVVVRVAFRDTGAGRFAVALRAVLEREGADFRRGDEVSLSGLADGRTAAVMSGAGGEVTFAIGTDEGAVERAIRAARGR